VTDIDSMSLDLPAPIEAEPGKIRSGADDLDELHSDMLGQSRDTDAQMRSSADQFTDRIAWDISSAAADELMAWEETSKALTYGSGVLRLWAEDIDTYMTERAAIVSRWETAKENAQTSPDMGPGPSNADRLEQTRENLRSEHASIWGTLMEQAEQTKIDLRTGPSKDTLERMVEAGLLTTGQIATYGDYYPGMMSDELDGNESPQSVNIWWDALSEEEREQAMANEPDLLRGLDGIPSDVRDQLNREHLVDSHDDIKDEIAELEAELDDLPNAPGNSGDRSSLEGQIEELESQKTSMETLHGSLGDSAEDSNKYLLAFERDEHGRAIVSEGNPDTADNVATMVPGTNTTWESINGQMEHAGAVKTESDLHGGEGSSAVISWIGYDAPENAEAISSEYADEATDDLSRFQDGLRVTQEGSVPSHNTVIGHSYGSTVIGHTALSENGIDADDIVLVGSPGVSVDRASELGFDPANVHATTAENDHINDPWVLVHGQDPTSEEFGATTFDSNPGPEGGGIMFGDAHGQNQYFKEEVDEEADHDPLAYIGEVVSGSAPGTS